MGKRDTGWLRLVRYFIFFLFSDYREPTDHRRFSLCVSSQILLCFFMLTVKYSVTVVKNPALLSLVSTASWITVRYELTARIC